MADDLVARLRDSKGGYEALEINATEAADEIERLKKLVTTWIICAEMLVESQDGKNYKKAMKRYLDCQRIANETCK